MNKLKICAFGLIGESGEYHAGYAADTLYELLKMMHDDGSAPEDYHFFEVGDPLTLTLERKEILDKQELCYTANEVWRSANNGVTGSESREIISVLYEAGMLREK